MGPRFIVTPPFQGDVEVGPAGDPNRVYLGRLGETGPSRKVFFNAGKEFVTLILGKRGSGKSYTLGDLIEGLVTRASVSSLSSLSTNSTRPGVLLLDPLQNFWTFDLPVSADPERPKVRRQFELLDGWECKPEDSNVELWLPRGAKRDFDYSSIREFMLRTSDLDPQDWADVVGTNLVRDPQGMLLAEALELVTELGWTDAVGRPRTPTRKFELRDLIDCVTSGRSGLHQDTTARALARTLESWDRQGIFRKDGTPLTDLVKSGHVSVLMLPHRIGHDFRAVITRVLIRRLLKEREAASQIRQRLDVESLTPATRGELEARLAALIPKTILAIDEAQELLGEEAGEAREALEDFCLLGRNYGLSLILATQRPTTTAISAKVRSMVGTYFVHRLLTQDDIDITYRNLISQLPDEIRLGNHVLDFARTVRSLETGQCLVTAERISSRDSNVRRAFFLDVRPRTRVHGGEVS